MASRLLWLFFVVCATGLREDPPVGDGDEGSPSSEIELEGDCGNVESFLRKLNVKRCDPNESKKTVCGGCSNLFCSYGECKPSL